MKLGMEKSKLIKLFCLWKLVEAYDSHDSWLKVEPKNTKYDIQFFSLHRFQTSRLQDIYKETYDNAWSDLCTLLFRPRQIYIYLIYA